MPKYWGKQIFAHGRFPEVGQKQKIYVKKKYVFWVIFFPPKKKGDFRAIFLLFTASVRSRPPGPPAVPGVFI